MNKLFLQALHRSNSGTPEQMSDIKEYMVFNSIHAKVIYGEWNETSYCLEDRAIPQESAETETNALSKVLEVFQILQPARSRSVVEETSGLWIWSYADYPAIKIKLPWTYVCRSCRLLGEQMAGNVISEQYRVSIYISEGFLSIGIALKFQRALWKGIFPFTQVSFSFYLWVSFGFQCLRLALFFG